MGARGSRTQGAAAMPVSPKLREELANSASHVVGALLALVALPVLAADDVARAPAQRHFGVWIFAATMLLVYVVSSAYHAAPAGPAKGLLKRLDHAAIYLFMAGTF